MTSDLFRGQSKLKAPRLEVRSNDARKPNASALGVFGVFAPYMLFLGGRKYKFNVKEGIMMHV